MSDEAPLGAGDAESARRRDDIVERTLDAEPAFVETKPAFVEPESEFVEPEGEFVEPEGAFVEPADEFGLLAEIASERGIDGPLPIGRRVTTHVGEKRTVSALVWGDTPRVTFLHGAGLNAHTWDTTVAALGVDALAIDLPGHGDSSWRDDADYRARTLAPDVAAVLRERTDRPQVIVGQSLGGFTAAALAATDPDLVRAVVIVDITPGVDRGAGPAQLRAFFAGPTDWASRDELVDRAVSFGLGGGTRRRAARGVYFNSRIRPDGRVEWKHHFAHLAAAAAAAPASPPAASAAEGWSDLTALHSPVTLVRGDRGFVTGEDADEWRERVAGAGRAGAGRAEVVTLHGGHNLQEDDPIGLAEVIRGVVIGD